MATHATVITYGTFDLFHEGHRRLLERARELGDRLIVGVTTENYDDSRGKLNIHQSLMERIENVRGSGLVDEIIIEEYEGQKVTDIQKYGADIFAIGSDWLGKFDFLKDYCEVVYLERTTGVSSTELRARSAGILGLGVVGTGRIANRFVPESKFVSGVDIPGVYGVTPASVEAFAARHELSFSTTDYDEFLSRVDAVYIASPHQFHADQVRRALTAGKHVLAEKPLSLTAAEVRELTALASDNGLVLLEAIKTAYSPGFIRLVAIARSGLIGNIRNVEATFTKLSSGELRELDAASDGGSVTELASYPLLAVAKLLGTAPLEVSAQSLFADGYDVDVFTKINLRFEHALASVRVGLGVKSEGDLVIGGTSGYIYVPSPWWKTEYFEVRYENPADNKKYFYRFDGDGLRYEIAEFSTMIAGGDTETYKLTAAESVFIADMIERSRPA
ncbi:Gfo/Idh/MocA family oxidoreductase [Glaciihabitans sp. dw_435]|uniref:Gfo/Idh/MocA family oxidoreductase n=1 Tax=Glaciihabitans sp. dw_435 TaxID=2720081 RepID=UPI001BD1CCE1|nr:Gfo/Idh/MocA family oxidoreductase [Glaciihabitans sp. dw_435]